MALRWKSAFGASSFLILVEKSETRTIQRQHARVNSVCQLGCPREHDFASGIIFGESHMKVMMAYLVLTT
jgi:hypothetical protein